jgi:phosphoserine aminotransferase
MMGDRKYPAYINTGTWSAGAIKEVPFAGGATANVIASSQDRNFCYIPKNYTIPTDSDYLHITTNNTIEGTQFHHIPQTSVPLVADMSSDIFSKVIDVSQFDLIYAGAQKNMGPSGVTLVIVRRDLFGHALPTTPSAFNYQLQADNDSMYNTPPTYAIYIMGLVLAHIQTQGGLSAMQAHNQRKADVLYEFLDHSIMFSNRVAREDRSLMNVTFFLKDEALNAAFVQGAEKEGMVQLRGHRSAGGMRASIYNAMSLQSVQRLRDYMHRFEKENA